MNSFYKSISANFLLTIWQIIFQLVSVPVFLFFWGTAKYGEWLLLNSFTVFFQMSDLGINTSSLNSFVINYKKENIEKCRVIMITSIIFITSIFSLVLICLISLFNLSIFGKILKLNSLSADTVFHCILLMLLYTYLGTLANVINSIYNAKNKYSRGLTLDNIFKIMEGLLLIASVLLNISFLSILLIFCVLKIIHLLTKYIDSKNYFDIVYRFKYFDLEALKELFKPSMAFLLMPISNTFISQGFLFLINYYLGPNYIVLYSTTRTLINTIRSFCDIFSRSMWPNITLAFSNSNHRLLRLYHSRVLMLTLIVFFLSTIFLFLFGKIIYVTWTAGKSEFDIILVLLLLIALLGNLIQSSGSLILQATNQHTSYSIMNFLFSFVGFVVAFTIVRISKSVTYLPIGLIISEVLLSFYVIKRVFFLNNDSLFFFFKRMRFDFIFQLNLIKQKF